VERPSTTDLRVVKTLAARPAGISNPADTAAYPERCPSLCLVSLTGCRAIELYPHQSVRQRA
jgi:predicted aminopeptidase